MNNYSLIIENAAQKDMLLIADYIAIDNKKAALQLVKTFYGKFSLLCSNPNIGTIRKDFTYKNVRFYVIKKRYLVVYTIVDNSLHILRVLSSYQDICSNL